MKTLPIPADIKRTLLDALKTDEEEYGRSAETENARSWLAALEKQWPSLESVPDLPIAGARHT